MRRSLINILVLTLLYFLTARLSLYLAIAGTNSSAVWPPAGIAVTAIILFGYGIAPGVFIGALSANFVAFISSEHPADIAAYTSLIIACGNTAEAIGGAWILRKVAPAAGSFSSLRGILLFVVCGLILTPGLSALPGVLAISTAGVSPWAEFPYVLINWWTGDAVGILIIVPLALTFRNKQVFHRPAGRLETTLALAGAILSVPAAFFLTESYPLSHISSIKFFPFIFIFWSTIRIGAFSGAVSVFAVMTMAVLLTVAGTGPFVSLNPFDSLLELTTYISVFALINLILCGAMGELQQVLGELQTANDRLESRVRARTTSLEKANQRLSDEVERRIIMNRELRQARDEAQSANRLKSNMLANVSHELRTPLNAIIGFTELALSDSPTSGLHKVRTEYLQNVSIAGKQLLGLIQDLLDLSMIEVGRLKLDRGPFDLGQLLEETTKLHLSQARSKSIAIDVDTADNTPVNADRKRIGQVINNLLSNALKFTQQGGAIRVRLTSNGSGVTTIVQDNGIGIDDHKINSIFSEFVQGDDNRNRRYGGVGLGLSISRKIIELHGGEIQANSRKGLGSSFSFTLPAADSGGRPEAPH